MRAEDRSMRQYRTPPEAVPARACRVQTQPGVFICQGGTAHGTALRKVQRVKEGREDAAVARGYGDLV